jgi:hypothetical protein
MALQIEAGRCQGPGGGEWVDYSGLGFRISLGLSSFFRSGHDWQELTHCLQELTCLIRCVLEPDGTSLAHDALDHLTPKANF